MQGRKLTKTVIDGLAASGSDRVVWCGELPGFGVRVRPSGSKTFVVMYRTGGRSSTVRKVTIGRVDKITTEIARAEARRILASAELGIDVGAQKAAKNAEMTVAQLCDLYLAEGAGLKKASTLVSDRSRIERHIKPLIGKKRIGDITRADMDRLLRDIAAGKTARDEKGNKPRSRSIVRGGKGAATRTLRQLGGLFTWAIHQGYLNSNPCYGVKLYPDGKGDRFLSSAELQRLGDTLRLAETEGLPSEADPGNRDAISLFVLAAIKLLILTGCRRGEILNLRWSEVDLENELLLLADSKTGAKKVWLTAPALEVLSSLPRLGEYVIAGADPNKPRPDIDRPWHRIRRYAGLQGLRLHDLRHSYASVGAASGMGLPVIGKLLGHASPATTNRYAHLADDPVRVAGERIAETIAAAMNGAGGGEVIALRGRR
jgi:integrase